MTLLGLCNAGQVHLTCMQGCHAGGAGGSSATGLVG